MGIELSEDFNDSLRAVLGVEEFDLTDTEITAMQFISQAKLNVKKRVPEYADITDENDLFYLERAVLYYTCYLTVPVLARKLNRQTKTIDLSWTKFDTDWNKVALDYLDLFENALSNIESVGVVTTAVKLVDVALNNEDKIGFD